MKTSTVTMVKYLSIGLLIGVVFGVMRITGNQYDAPGQVIGAILGPIIAAMVVTGILGYLQARKQPAAATQAPPMSKARKIVLFASLGFLAVAIGSLALLPLMR